MDDFEPPPEEASLRQTAWPSARGVIISNAMPPEASPQHLTQVRPPWTKRRRLKDTVEKFSNKIRNLVRRMRC